MIKDNKYMTKKEHGLLKGSMRRVFSRSEARKFALSTATIDYSSIIRPRVKKWGKCALCNEPTPLYLMQVDHIQPIVPMTVSLETMTWDEVVNRIWTDPDNLQVLCKPCHKGKTSVENKERRRNRKNE